jgi:hypothetical protein
VHRHTGRNPLSNSTERRSGIGWGGDPDAALHAGLRSAQNAEPAAILLIGSQRTVRATEAVGGARGGCADRAGRADAHSTDGAARRYRQRDGGADRRGDASGLTILETWISGEMGRPSGRSSRLWLADERPSACNARIGRFEYKFHAGILRGAGAAARVNTHARASGVAFPKFAGNRVKISKNFIEGRFSDVRLDTALME